MCVCARTCLVTQLCQTFCNLLDYSPPGSSIYGILHFLARPPAEEQGGRHKRRALGFPQGSDDVFEDSLRAARVNCRLELPESRDGVAKSPPSGGPSSVAAPWAPPAPSRVHSSTSSSPWPASPQRRWRSLETHLGRKGRISCFRNHGNRRGKLGRASWGLMRRVDSLEKTLMLGGIGGRRKRG